MRSCCLPWEAVLTVALSPWVLMRSRALSPPPPPGIELQNIKPLAEYKTAASIRLLGNGLSHDLHGSSPALLFHVIPIVAWDKNHRDLAGVVASFLCLGKQHVAQILKWLFVSPPFGSGRSWL